ncbi:MAG: hypothetical protein QG654_105 [Patescibacteria group bacterium]|jgi:hypothetical protein|nr:hypothetical protein [Patescibacteria group bacterium]
MSTVRFYFKEGFLSGGGRQYKGRPVSDTDLIPFVEMSFNPLNVEFHPEVVTFVKDSTKDITQISVRVDEHWVSKMFSAGRDGEQFTTDSVRGLVVYDRLRDRCRLDLTASNTNFDQIIQMVNEIKNGTTESLQTVIARLKTSIATKDSALSMMDAVQKNLDSKVLPKVKGLEDGMLALETYFRLPFWKRWFTQAPEPLKTWFASPRTKKFDPTW